MADKVTATPEALQLLAEIVDDCGPVLFHQSGGCCDGSSPMCYPRGEFKVGAQDVYMGEIGGQPFYMGRSQFEYWQHTHLIIESTSITASTRGDPEGKWTCAVAAAVFRLAAGISARASQSGFTTSGP